MTKNKKRKIDASQTGKDNNLSSGSKASETNFLERAIGLVRKGDIDSLKEVIKKQPEIVNESDDGSSLLNYAVSMNNREIVELLLKEGASVEIKGYFGSTPLHVAARNANLELIKLLVEDWGANVKVLDDFNNSVLHSAASGMISEESKENGEIIEYLLEKDTPVDIVSDSNLSVSDIFFTKDGSYADIYERKKKEGESGEAKIKWNERKNLEEEIEKILNFLLPKENDSDYASIKSLLEAIMHNQKQLVESNSNLSKVNIDSTKEIAFNKNLDREKIEELCQKVAKLVEITSKKDRIEFVEEQGKPKPSMIRFNR